MTQSVWTGGIVVLLACGSVAAQTATFTHSATPTRTYTPTRVPIGLGCAFDSQCVPGAACVGNLCTTFTATATPMPMLTATHTRTHTRTPTPTRVPIGVSCTFDSQCVPGAACVGNLCTVFTPSATPTSTFTATYTPTPTSPPTPTRTVATSVRSLSINDIRFAEGHPLPIFFTVTLSQAAPFEVRVDYFPSDGTALADLDYFASPGTLVFAPGQTQLRIPVSFRNDTVVEPDETFVMNLTRPLNASIARARGVATIVNDDTVGTLELHPAEASVIAGERIVLTLRWVHPISWRHLDTVDLRLLDDENPVLWIRFDEAAGAFALCMDEDDCGPGTAPDSDAVLRAGAARLFLDGSRARGSGPTGPSVELVYSLAVEPSLAGRELRVEAAATDDDGERQSFAQVGTVMVEGRSSSTSSSGGGCTVAAPPARTWTATAGLVGPLLAALAARRLRRARSR